VTRAARPASVRARELAAKHPELSAAEIAEQLGISRQLVHAALRRGSTPGRPRKPRTAEQRVAEVARLRAALRKAEAG
jgi:IS30 family transposase